MAFLMAFGAFILLFTNGILGVKIRELSVPSMVELGSENILLDCDFDYNDTERIQLDIKWYFEDEPSPFYQWVPEQMARPQIIGEKFRQHIDLDHVVHTDSHKKHRALLLKKPTTELSGSYTCKVSTFVSEDVRRKKMIVFSPATSVTFQQERITGHQVNVSCAAKNIYPQPQIRLTWGQYEFDDSEAQVVEYNNRYDIIVHRRVNHSEIPPETVFGCVLRIPGTDYEIREESIYKHRHGKRYSHHMASRSSDLGYNQNLLLLQCVTMVTLYLQKSVH